MQSVGRAGCSRSGGPKAVGWAGPALTAAPAEVSGSARAVRLVRRVTVTVDCVVDRASSVMSVVCCGKLALHQDGKP